MNQILKVFIKRLTNLSTRNKSLLLTSLPGEQFLDLMDTDFVLGSPAFKIISDLVDRKNRIALCDLQDPRYDKVNLLSKKLRKIARTENFIEEERGSRDLYIGYPFIRGKFADGTPVHAPLLYFPVTLKTEKEQWCLFPREDSEIAFNQSFALAYSLFNEVKMPDEVLEKSFNEFSTDIVEFHTQLYEWLKETPFRINFNQELFDNILIHFDLQKVADLRLLEKNGELKLFPEAVLGIFPQAGSYLVPDYNFLLDWNEEEDGPIKLPLLDTSFSDFDSEISFKSEVKEEDTLTPFSIDESQELIVSEVKRGKSIVVQGPPGSGKSQLICNLVTDFMARGKTVLVVCQKRAALDVVHQRLKSIGLDPFIALIHDFRNDRNALYKQLKQQIDHIDGYRQENYSLDAVFLERKFIQESRNIDKIVKDLNDFRSALFDTSECGMTVKELYLSSDIDVTGLDLSSSYRSFRFDSLSNFDSNLKMLLECNRHLGKGHLWEDRRSFATFGLGELDRMEQMLEDWPSAFDQQKQRVEDLTGAGFSPELFTQKEEISAKLNNITELIQSDISYQLLRKYYNESKNVTQRLDYIRKVLSQIVQLYNNQSVEVSLQARDLAKFQELLQNALITKQSAVKGKLWEWFNDDFKIIKTLTDSNNLTTSYEDLSELNTRIKNRLQIEHWLRDPLLHFNQYLTENEILTEENAVRLLKASQAATLAVIDIHSANMNSFFTRQLRENENLDEFKSFCQSFGAWLKIWQKMENAMSPFLTTSQILKLITSDKAYSFNLLAVLKKDFDVICESDQVYTSLSQTEKSVVDQLMDFGSEHELSELNKLSEVFSNSLKLAWIQHIENKYPILRSVSSLKMKQWEEQLQESILSREQLSRDIATIRIREFTYQDIEKNRLGNRVTYRELDHQVTKKRRIWPIRKLLEQYSDEIFPLVPCWLASPESVSAIFPMQAGLFDLVIFDESSQCYAEFGIPASFRGKQVVIAGDSKQLAPFELYQVRYEEQEDDDYVPATEVISLLDLAMQALDQFQLTGHYRSISLDLIEFSNKNFYNNTLRLTPEFKTVIQNEPGIEYVKTDGVWKNNINQIEIEKVQELLETLIPTGKSIGIVTFNFFQQQAIQEKLELAGLMKNDLFVKNIENVQGDERDIIIFSMGYAANENSKVVMQFGSLNAQGGENRLNVAVTRAREKIYFVSSLWPEQLNTESAVNEGPKLLKQYMQYAKTVSDGHFVANPYKNVSSYRSNSLLKDKLAQMNDQFIKELPFSDITIKEGEVYKGLALTDDDLYLKSYTSKEPHAYLPLLLRQKNWPFQRFFSRNYWTKSIDI